MYKVKFVGIPKASVGFYNVDVSRWNYNMVRNTLDQAHLTPTLPFSEYLRQDRTLAPYSAPESTPEPHTAAKALKARRDS